jgi:hypothetical protein
MSKRAFQLLLLSCLVQLTLSAANDPFIGKWKLNPSKSKLTDVMKVEASAANKYALDFGGGTPENVVADGTDQPGLDGTTVSITVDAPDTWKVVRKKGGRPLITGIWKLSKDGQTLSDAFTANQPNGSTFSLDYVYKRTARSTGFPGTWESTSEKMNSVFEIEIRPHQKDGLSFINPAQRFTKNLKFDGNDYPVQGPDVTPGSASSGRRVNLSIAQGSTHGGHQDRIHRSSESSLKCGSLRILVQNPKIEPCHVGCAMIRRSSVALPKVTAQ